jgi:hypothetical protein
MVAPVECSYGTVSFGHYKNTTILTQFRPNLIYYKMYIDDVIGILLPPKRNKPIHGTTLRVYSATGAPLNGLRKRHPIPYISWT